MCERMPCNAFSTPGTPASTVIGGARSVLPTDEAVEVIEPHPAGPLVKGPRRAYLIAGRVVVLAEPRRPQEPTRRLA